MARIDFWSLILGVLLSIVGAGIYDFVFYLLQGSSKTAEIQSSFWATIITTIIFIAYSVFFFLIKSGNGLSMQIFRKTVLETEKPRIVDGIDLSRKAAL